MAKRVYDKEYHANYHQANKEKINERTRLWAENNKERLKENNSAYRERNKDKIKEWKDDNKDLLYFLSLRARAGRKGIAFDLEQSDVTSVVICPVFGVPLIRAAIKPAWNSSSVDRIDNTKGYVKGNIQIMSYLANSMKRDATNEQLVLFAEWVLKEKKAGYNDKH